MSNIINIGTKTKYGRVIAVGFVGERYYWLINKNKTISMMPAKIIESNGLNKSKKDKKLILKNKS